MICDAWFPGWVAFMRTLSDPSLAYAPIEADCLWAYAAESASSLCELKWMSPAWHLAIFALCDQISVFVLAWGT